MTSSVSSRRARPGASFSYDAGSTGSPKRIATPRRGRGIVAPIGCTRSVPTSPTGSTAAPVAMASHPTPVRPR